MKTKLHLEKSRYDGTQLDLHYLIMFWKSTLEFDLRVQEYIELSRKRKTMEAIAYSKKYLIPWQDTHLAEIKQLSALLAFPPNTNCGPYKVSYTASLSRIRFIPTFRGCMILRDGILLRTTFA